VSTTSALKWNYRWPARSADRAGVDRAVHRCLIHNTLMNPPKIAIEIHTPASV